MRTPRGLSSYQLFAERIHELAPNARAILEVGCGDGLLLRRLWALYHSKIELVGVDLSEAELDRARRLFGEADYICADARTADFGVERFDAVVSHLVLMIASQPERILQSVRRSLRPSGLLISVIQRSWQESTLNAVLAAAMRALQSEHQTALPSIPERARFEDIAELHRVIESGGFHDVIIEPYEVAARFSREETWAFVQRIYHFGLLSATSQAAIRAAVDAALTDMLDEDGRFEATMPLQLIIARA